MGGLGVGGGGCCWGTDAGGAEGGDAYGEGDGR